MVREGGGLLPADTTELVGTYLGLAAAHSIGGIPIVVVIVAAALQGVDRQLEQGAAASPCGGFCERSNLRAFGCTAVTWSFRRVR